MWFKVKTCLLCRCGPATRVTILKDSLTGHPTGTAYVQFLTCAQAAAALALTGSALLQRPITVTPKPSRPHPTPTPSFQHPSSMVVAAPYSPFGYQHSAPQYSGAPYSGSSFSGRGEWTQTGRGRCGRGASHASRGGRNSARGGRGSEQNKSNVYIRPGLKQ